MDAPNAHPLLTDLTGQSTLKQALKSLIVTARREKRPIDHILIQGPRGMGKTAFAEAVANELHAPFSTTPPEALDDPVALADLLMHLPLGGILLVEHMDRLGGRCVEMVHDCIGNPRAEVLAHALNRGRSVRLPLPRFSVIGTAETIPTIPRAANGPVRYFVLDPYTDLELQEIVVRAAGRDDLWLQRPAVERIVGLADGTPERALHIFHRMRKLLGPVAGGTIRLEAAQKALSALGYG